MNKVIACIFFVLAFCLIKGQQANYWYFGMNAGLNFNTPIPTILVNGQTTNFDNSSTISDASGNLLFSTTGITVWDKNQNVMPNGAGLIGNFTAGQCAVIVPIPCSPSKYVIFHNTEYSNPGFLHYTVVDMSLNGGLGDVVVAQKNVSLGAGWTEKLCAYYNPVGNFYWVVTHKWLSDQYVAFKVDQNTIATTSVVTSIGSILNCGTVGGVHDAMGQLTISQDGTKLINSLTCVDKFELFDFNVNTGSLSNLITLPGDGKNAWGTAFSPDSKKLYVNSIFGKSVYQFDLTVYNQAAIVASENTLVTMPGFGYNFGYMELGPNGKIYITQPNTTWLSCVNTPNNLGAASAFTLNGQSVAPMQSKWGLSRIAYNIQSSSSSLTLTASTNSITCFGMSNGSATIASTPSSVYSYTWLPNVSTSSVANNLSAGIYSVLVSDGACLSSSITLSIVQPPKVTSDFTFIFNPCKGTFIGNNISQGATSYTWNYGNGNFSNSSNPSFTYTQPGTYTISLIAGNPNNCIDSVQKVVTVIPSSKSIFSYTANLCDSVVKLVNSSIGTNYQWDFGDGHLSNSISPLTHIYSNPGTYVITLIADPSSNCPDTSKSVVSITFNAEASFSLLVNNCNREISTVNGSTNASNYYWDFGTGATSQLTNPTYSYVSMGDYTISLIVNKGSSCADTMEKVVNFGNVIKANFTFNLNPCTGLVSFSNTSTNSNSFYWNFGDYNGVSYLTSPSYKYNKSNNYVVELIANPGTSCADTIKKPVPINLQIVKADFDFVEPELTYDVQFINKSTNATIFLWDFNDGSNTPIKDPKHTFQSVLDNIICLSAISDLGCGDTICKEIKIKPDWTLYVPNCFTPNEDGLNDTFYALGTNIKQFNILIFDRWGEELFKSNDLGFGWNGVYKSKVVQDDVYAWKINFIDLYNKSHIMTGHVVVIK